MRVRKRENVELLLQKHPDLVFSRPCDWSEVFKNNHPIHIEVGCGKGDFIAGMALRHPEINYIGIDLQETVISYAMDKILERNLTNVRLLLVDRRKLTEYFSEGEVELLYLNFSDPWPKNRHEKRRLTYKSFLERYEQILQTKGQIHFKTDNRRLFEYSLASMSQYGMTLNRVWLDLHEDLDFAKENVLTEYERKFSAKGPIYRLEAAFNENNL